jgi:hypothetical protein
VQVLTGDRDRLPRAEYRALAGLVRDLAPV